MRIFAYQRKPAGKPGYMLPKQARYQLRYTPMIRFCNMLPKQARYQLRYTPMIRFCNSLLIIAHFCGNVKPITQKISDSCKFSVNFSGVRVLSSCCAASAPANTSGRSP